MPTTRELIDAVREENKAAASVTVAALCDRAEELLSISIKLEKALHEAIKGIMELSKEEKIIENNS